MFNNLQTSSNVNGVILKLTYLPAIWVAKSLDNKSLLEPVIKIDVFLVALNELTTFSHLSTF